MNKNPSIIPAKLRLVVQRRAPLLNAFSGGQNRLVLLAKARNLVLPVAAATIVSGLAVSGEAEQAAEMCRKIGVSRDPIQVQLLEDAAISSNPVHHCYLWKQQIMRLLLTLPDELGIPRVPPSSCLSTRLPLGVTITVERLKLIAATETLLCDQRIFGTLRVRLIADKAVPEVEVEVWVLLGKLEGLGFSHAQVAMYPAGGVERWRQKQQ